jgi:hypothetical protein
MRRFAVVVFVLIAGLALSCGGVVFFVSTDGHNVSVFSASGTVSIVQLTVSNGNQFTVVTLFNTTGAQTFNFCGNVVNRFPMNASVTVNFTNRNGCSSINTIIIN